MHACMFYIILVANVKGAFNIKTYLFGVLLPISKPITYVGEGQRDYPIKM